MADVEIEEVPFQDAHISIGEGATDEPESWVVDMIIDQLKIMLAQDKLRVVDLFQSWDADGDGIIGKQEIAKALEELGYSCSGKELDALFRALDVNDNGSIAYQEMHNLLNSWDTGEEGIVIQLTCMLAQHKSRTIDNFRSWDVDGDGKIGVKELKRALLDLGYDAPKREVKALFKSFDTDQSGSIDFKEMHRVLRRVEDAQSEVARKKQDRASASAQAALNRVTEAKARAAIAAQHAANEAAKAKLAANRAAQATVDAQAAEDVAAKHDAEEEAATKAAKAAKEFAVAAANAAAATAARLAEEEAARLAAEEAARLKAEAEAAIVRAAAEEAARLKAEADRRAAEEAARLAVEEAERKAAGDEAARLAAEEAARLAVAEAARWKAEAEAAARRAAEKAAQEAARLKAEAERRASEEAARLAAEEAARLAAAEAARWKAEAEAAARRAADATEAKAAANEAVAAGITAMAEASQEAAAAEELVAQATVVAAQAHLVVNNAEVEVSHKETGMLPHEEMRKRATTDRTARSCASEAAARVASAVAKAGMVEAEAVRAEPATGEALKSPRWAGIRKGKSSERAQKAKAAAAAKAAARVTAAAEEEANVIAAEAEIGEADFDDDIIMQRRAAAQAAQIGAAKLSAQAEAASQMAAAESATAEKVAQVLGMAPWMSLKDSAAMMVLAKQSARRVASAAATAAGKEAASAGQSINAPAANVAAAAAAAARVAAVAATAAARGELEDAEEGLRTANMVGPTPEATPAPTPRGDTSLLPMKASRAPAPIPIPTVSAALAPILQTKVPLLRMATTRLSSTFPMLDWSRRKLNDDELDASLGESLAEISPHTVWLQENYLSIVAGPIVGRELSNARIKVTRLTLTGNRLGDKGVAGLMSALDQEAARSLRALNLGVNNLGASSVLLVANALVDGRLDALQELRMGGNPLGAVGGLSIAITLRRPNSTLVTLNLGNSSIGNQGDAAIADALGGDVAQDSTSLRPLQLPNCGLGASTAEKFGRLIASPKSGIVELSLAGNPLTPAGAASVTGALRLSRTLSRVWLESTHLDDSATPGIAAALSTSNCQLAEMWLSANAISNMSTAVIASVLESKSVSEGPKLRKLWIGDTEMTPNSARSVIEQELACAPGSGRLPELKQGPEAAATAPCTRVFVTASSSGPIDFMFDQRPQIHSAFANQDEDHDEDATFFITG